MKKNKLLFFSLLLLLLLGASFICAQRPLEINYPEIPGAITPTDTKEALPDYIRYIFQFSLLLGAFIALGSFIYGGFRYLISAGSAAVIKNAKDQMTAGSLGLLILVCAYLILNTINPQLIAMDVSLLDKAPTDLPAAGPQKGEPSTFLEIPLGGLIENVWGERSEEYPSGFKSAECYDYEADLENPPLLTDYNRLDCIQKLSFGIEKKAENLKKPIEELQKLYDCQNCCRDCCKNGCGIESWTTCEDICDKQGTDPFWRWGNCPLGSCCDGTKNEGCWENETCGNYECCEGQGMVKPYSRSCQKCPYSCCEFFEECVCNQCGFEANWCEKCNCICIKEDENKEPICCNPENPNEHWEDPLVAELIEEIKTALKELRLILGLSPLTEALEKNQRICCQEQDCQPKDEIGVIDCLLKDADANDLIKKMLLGDLNEGEFTTIDEEKLKDILRIPLVMRYLIESNLLLTDKNSAKIMLRNIGMLKNEVGFNEVAWMGTQADSTDEWIELYNNTKEEIDFTDWKLSVKDKFEIELSGTIPSGSASDQGFYLLENNENAISDIEADLIYNGNLADSGEILKIYDEFGNLVEEMECGTGWFNKDNNIKASMERINPQGDMDIENWMTNVSIKVKEEWQEDYINGKDRDGNLIYGTPGKPNSVGVRAIPYSPFSSMVGEMSNKLNKEEKLRKKLVLVLRKDENLEKLIKSKENITDILIGEDWRFKNLLGYKDVLRILTEDEEHLNALFENEYIKEIIKDILIKTSKWKEEGEGEELENEWEELLINLPIIKTNLKLINDFHQDIAWVLEARGLMKNCDNEPISYDQFRMPEEFISKAKIEEMPEWENIKKEIPFMEGADPSIFYCYEPLW